MPPLLLDILYLPIALLYLPFLLYQMVVLHKNRRGWCQRFGFVPIRTSDRPCVWIHAVSLGEVHASRSLAEEIARRLPDHELVISATTDTGYAAARRLFPDTIVLHYPLDFSFAVKRAMRRIRPAAIILMELEAWPNFINLATRHRIPVGIANGRVTHGKSMRRFRLPGVRTLVRKMFSQLSWIAAQNQTYADRFVLLGADSQILSITGSMKYDTARIAEHLPGDTDLAKAMGIDLQTPLLVAGSTGPCEEAMLLDAFTQLRADFSDLQLAIIPRKPERFEEIAQLIKKRGFHCRRRSRHPDGTSELTPKTDQARGQQSANKQAVTLFLGDTMGELRKFYALADGVFVGRSLIPMGGSDLMEVAALARPMCFGPYTENFADVAEQLITAKAAVQLDGPADLVETLRSLLVDPSAAQAMGRRAQEVVRQNTGATKKTVELLCKSL